MRLWKQHHNQLHSKQGNMTITKHGWPSTVKTNSQPLQFATVTIHTGQNLGHYTAKLLKRFCFSQNVFTFFIYHDADASRSDHSKVLFSL